MEGIRGIKPEFWSLSIQAIQPQLVYTGQFPERPIEYYALAPTATRRSYVYILTDADDAVLYVGMSRNPGSRFDRHRTRDWWPHVDGLTLLAVSGEDKYEARAVALWLEARAIRKLRPVHNILGVTN